MDHKKTTILDNGILETKSERPTGAFMFIEYTTPVLDDDVKLWVSGGCVKFKTVNEDYDELILTADKAIAIRNLMDLAIKLIADPDIHTIKDLWNRYHIIMSPCGICGSQLTPLMTAQRSEAEARQWAEDTYPGLKIVSIERYPNG